MVSSITFSNSKSTSLLTLALDMPAGAGTTQWPDPLVVPYSFSYHNIAHTVCVWSIINNFVEPHGNKIARYKYISASISPWYPNDIHPHNLTHPAPPTKAYIGQKKVRFGSLSQPWPQAGLLFLQSSRTKVWTRFDLGATTSINGTLEMLRVEVADATGATVCNNPVAFAHPKDMVLPKADVTFSIGDQLADGAPVPITVKADSFALYVTLTTLAQGLWHAD